MARSRETASALVEFAHMQWIVAVIVIIATVMSVVEIALFLAFGVERDFLEIAKLLADASVAAIALYAIKFAKDHAHHARLHAEELEKTRKVQVYMEIITFWNSPPISASREKLLALAREHAKLRYGEFCLCDDYINYKLVRMKAEDYSETVRVMEFLEYIGLLCNENQVDKRQIFNFLGSRISQIIETFMLSHISLVRRRNRSSSNYAYALYLVEEAKRAQSAEKFSVGGYGHP
ncbi:MAG TPA: hypothetical protein VND19_22255 [Acetobacteraceae bacterium]|nr:hypothetical protein [Acetobacteraceae bacterium]